MIAKAALAALLAVSGCASIKPGPAPWSPWAASNPSWIEPFAPFRIEDGVYFVGTKGLSSFLVTTPDGHFLLDGGLPENAKIIARNIETLGFNLRDIRYLLNSHAHFDHSGGLAALKKMTDAALVASEPDRSALEGGFYLGSEGDPSLGAPPVAVDRTIADGEALILGGVAMTARLTPGHTRGCTSWTMTAGGRDILFFCSASVAANRLVASSDGPPQYEGIVEDYRATFDKLRSWRPDIFLSNHPEVFGMEERRARQLGGKADAFVDREVFPAVVVRLGAAFEKALAEQTAIVAGSQ
ncbi:MAG: subclass B3 metallo-beta-lactamase [Parvularculaceae bacterium]